MDIPSITYSVRKKSWILVNDFYFAHGISVIKIPKEFEFNLASVPRFLWVIIPPFSLSILAPLVHDYIYRTRGEVENTKYTRRDTDKLFKDLMKSEGVSRFQTSIAYLAVRAFGWIFWYDVWKMLFKWYGRSKTYTNIYK
jgi:hypothetical protein